MTRKKHTEFNNTQDSIGTMDIDRSEDKIVWEGRLDVSKSGEGLKTAQQAVAFWQNVCSELEALDKKRKLPERLQDIAPVMKDNPYLGSKNST